MPSKALSMAPAAFQLWCRTRALAPSTCDYLSTIRGSQPVRRVTSRAHNVSGAYLEQPWFWELTAQTPRHGSRPFEVAHDQFIYTLLGNTQAAKRACLLTCAVDPKHHALWMLPDLYTYLCEYAYQVYDQNEHSDIGMTPQAAYLWGMKQGGGARASPDSLR